MSATTLVTFSVSIPHRNVTFVQLLGSWNGFTKPYLLERDARAGRAIWKTCPSFTDITCDGKCIVKEPRSGALQMGSTYWYYYLVDDDEELVDPTQPITRYCPLLPGQEVNVLEVPVMLHERPYSSASAASSTEYTLNPSDKYAPIVAAPMSSAPTEPSHDTLASRKSSVAQLAALEVNHPSTPENGVTSRAMAALGLDRFRISMFSRNAAKVSTNMDAAQIDKVKRAQPPQSRRHVRKTTSQPALSRSATWSQISQIKCVRSAGGYVLPLRSPLWPAERLSYSSHDRFDSHNIVTKHSRAGDCVAPAINNSIPIAVLSTPRDDQTSEKSSEAVHVTHVRETPFLGNQLTLSFDDDFTSALDNTFGAMSLADDQTSMTSDSLETRSDWIGMQFSRRFDQDSSTSGSILSHPTKEIMAHHLRGPTMSWEDNIYNGPADEPDLPQPKCGLQGIYMLQPSDQTSVLTLHTLRALPDDSAATPTGSNINGPSSRRVEEWVDHSESTLEELHEDLGFLSALIV